MDIGKRKGMRIRKNGLQEVDLPQEAGGAIIYFAPSI